jgi:hypothetical protein
MFWFCYRKLNEFNEQTQAFAKITTVTSKPVPATSLTKVKELKLSGKSSV